MSHHPSSPVSHPGVENSAQLSPRDPPGPRHLFKLLALVRMARDPLRAPVHLFDRYGDFIRLGADTCITRDPHLLEQITQDYLTFGKNFTDHYGDAGLSFWGNGTGVRSDAGWLQHRRLIQAALLPARIDAYAEEIVRRAEIMLDTWDQGAQFDVYAELKRLTLGIMIRNQFGLDLGDADFERTRQALEAVLTLFNDLSQLELNFDTDEKLHFREAIAELNEIVYGVISQRRRDSHDRGDMLSAWMAATDDAGRRLTDEQLRDELVAHLRAGYRNTATVLCWAFVLLDRNPSADARLGDEVSATLDGRALDARCLPVLQYTEQVLKETMRLYPLYPMLGRLVTRDTTLGRYRLPKGTNIGISIWALHRDPRWFQEPDVFKPERWDGALERSLPRQAFIPFGGGPRQCPFKSYGMMESLLLIAATMRRFRVRLAPGEQAQLDASVNGLMPKSGLQVVLEERR